MDAVNPYRKIMHVERSIFDSGKIGKNAGKSEDFTIGRLHLRPKYPLIGYCFLKDRVQRGGFT
ncbi:hypothetical protein D3Z53_01625 [Lachnospiraceae bacterium]|nr:hypothetical protein [Lachnospiraceae bacterium]